MCAQVLGGLLRDTSLLLAVRPHFLSSLGPQVLHCCSVLVGRAIKDKWHNLLSALAGAANSTNENLLMMIRLWQCATETILELNLIFQIALVSGGHCLIALSI